ncbi:hypothetical protein TTHERM_00085510 (macronuclear) [Tetrahymena thermophila SB210]|uniref:Uncharacterized protein n=1 Tax=Tetrahymena thermophila (strain SB210) TaxID=312017 RepID=Q236P7_TETTS|nr:hypothetical protein TTHERM_00085510 [Tetrahymena thermophila SB210]EAR92453.2 hypothetical protein TTHERM_00085510 [Tetrahymena thermophila SB210]|eukprot:XP_001012698.2 hypothetical protein TTHERM_00085510 [Tetrahymena thermophila SB210]
MGNETSAMSPEQQAENYYFNGVDRFRPQVYKYNMSGSVVDRQQLNEEQIQKEAVQGSARFGNEQENVDRFKKGYNEGNLNQDIRREEFKNSIKYVPQDSIKDKDYIEFPRMTLMKREMERHYQSNDVHSVYQNLEVNPELMKRIDKHINKTEDQLERMDQEERKHTILDQLGRIAYLEDRMELLQKEISNQVFHLKYKHKKTLNFQGDYNKLRDETIAHHARINQFEEQNKMKDLTKVQEEMEMKEEDIRSLEKEIESYNDQINYWKQKASIDDNCIAIITSLKFRAQGLITENKRLKDILYKDEEYADIKNVMYDNKQIQLQQEIFEETDNLLKNYYESVTYDRTFDDKKNVSKTQNTSINTKTIKKN